MSAPMPPPRPGALRASGIVLGRELYAYMRSRIAGVFTVAALLLANSLFMNEFFLVGKLDMTPFFERLAPLSVLLLPAISMRLWAEDRRQRTLELWATLPLPTGALVAGKFLAAFTLFGIFLAGTLPIPAMLFALGDPDPGPIAGGYLGALALGALILSLGGMFSSLTRDQVVAFVTAALAAAALLALGEPHVVAVLDGTLPGVRLGTLAADWISALPRYERLVSGLVTAADLVWFAGLCAAGLVATAAVVERVRP